MSVKFYQNNMVHTVGKKTTITGATTSANGALSAADKKKINWLSTAYDMTPVTLYSQNSWATSGAATSGTLSKAYTNFDFIVIKFASSTNYVEYATVMVPTSVLNTSYNISYNFSPSGENRRIHCKFTSTTAWTVSRDHNYYSVQSIAGIGKRY